MSLESAIKKRNRKQYLTFWLLPLVVIGGWFYPLLGYLLPICMAAAIGIAFFKGRYWCDWLCPRGAAWDLLLSKLSLKKEIPAYRYCLRNSHTSPNLVQRLLPRRHDVELDWKGQICA